MKFENVFVDTEMAVVKKRCVTCTKVINQGNEGEQAVAVTDHLWTKVRPSPTFTEQPNDEVEAIELLKLSKRLVMCTECGSLSLTN